MLRYLRLVALASVLAHSLPGQAIPVAAEFDKLHFRSIGPATMSGRIADLAVYEANPAVFYVGTSHGGVWKTTSNGALFQPLFQNDGLMSIGAVAVSQSNPDLVWVGTGESNNRQSTSWGDGIYKSTDGGKTFTNMGLKDSKHIGRIVIDPRDNNIVLVAAAGPLFGPGGDRGVYKTIDGGKTWKQVLKGDEDTGANDIAMSKIDPKILFASTYQRRRTACCVNGGGPGSGIWKSTDGGDNWTRLSGGLPTAPMGRIALDIYRRSANIVYASIEGPAAPGGGRGGGAGAPDSTAADTAAAAPPPTGGRGGRGGGGGGRGGGGAGAAANAGITGVYRSDDGGTTWRKVGGVNPRPLYFSQMRVDPNSPDRIYMGGVKMQMSIDGGRTYSTNASLVIHDDIHAIWIDPSNSDHVLIGGDGGLGVSYDMAKTWEFMPNLPVGLFYHVSYDMDTPYNVCGGMQDNYDWCGPSASRLGRGIMNYDWFQIDGGDGFVSIPDSKDSRIIYTETQDGSIIRRNKITGESKSIRPSAVNVTNPPQGEAFRFQWDTPMILSPIDGSLLVGANHLFRSTDKGDSWTMLSPDLTTNTKRDTVVTMGLKGSDITIAKDDGIVAYSTIVAVAESPKLAGVYYTGSDDGVLSVSRDGGKSWSNITSHLPGFPKGGYVAKVAPSRFDAATVYVTVDNHRLNDYAPYMWASNDFGATFHSIVNNIKGENTRTITEDQRNPDVLYVGTETGILLSLDRGKSWRRLKANFPDVRVDEITLHPRDNAMLVATHGRALWILDHLEPIQEYTAAQTASLDAKLFNIPTALEWKSKDDRNAEFWGHQYFVGENPTFEAVIQFAIKKPLTDPKLKITDAAGKEVRTLVIPANRNVAGIQTVCWDMRIDPISADSAGAAPAGGRGAGGGGGGGGRGGGNSAVPGVPAPEVTPGYLPMDICTGGVAGGRGGGGGGGFGGGGGAAGPHVMPGTYTVSLMSGAKSIESKPIKIIMDPQVQFTVAQRTRYNEIVTDLHALQQRGTHTASSLNSLYGQMAAVGTKVKESTTVPAAVKTQFEAFAKDFDSLRVKFGVPTIAGGAGGRGGAGGGGGGRGGRGGGAWPDVLAKAGTVKGQIMGIWEMPSDAMMKQYTQVKTDLPKAINEAEAFLVRATAMSQTLKKYDVTLNVTLK